MLLDPSIMALLAAASINALLLLFASLFAIKVIFHWDIASGSEQQLTLERSTYLISTLVGFAFITEILSLALFVSTAEALSNLFTGAMCATGVLNMNHWGWLSLGLKITIFFASVIWLTINRLDNQAYDYPLIRLKYFLLLLLTPLVMFSAIAQWQFFSHINPDIITSCCGALFTPEGAGVAADLTGIAPRHAMLLFYLSGLLSLTTGYWYSIHHRGGVVFAIMTLLAFFMAIIAIVSFISPYIYAHPQHHCPFCLLKSGHHYIGYLLYFPLFTGTAFALSAASHTFWHSHATLTATIKKEIPFFSRMAIILLLIFYLLSTQQVIFSDLSMQDVWW